MIEEFIYHRRQVVHRRTEFELAKAKAREHLLAGFIIALKNIDEVVAIVKRSSTAEEAITELNKRFLLSSEQGKAILEMRLHRLTGLEQEKIYTELDEIKKEITFFNSILENESVLKQEVIKELVEVKEQYGDARKSRIEGAIDILTESDLIPDEEVVVTLTGKGYIKRVPLNVYDVQHRGGKGKMGMASLEDDYMADLFVAKNHDSLLFFTNVGRVYSLNVFEVPEASRTAKGRAVINLLPLQPGEHVVKLLCTRDLEKGFVIMLTKNGIIKRTAGEDFVKIRSTGIRALTLREDEKDELVFCAVSTGSCSIIIATEHGQGIRFKEDEVRAMGRQAAGVIGIRLKGKDSVVGMEVICDDSDILFATEHGYGKKVAIEDFRVAHRGGVGVRTIPTSGRNGKVIGLAIVTPNSNIMMIDQVGKIIRLPASEIRSMGRQAKGVRLIKLDKDQFLSNIFAFEESIDDNHGEGHASAACSAGNPVMKADGTFSADVYEMPGHDDSDALLLDGEGEIVRIDLDDVESDEEEQEIVFDESVLNDNDDNLFI